MELRLWTVRGLKRPLMVAVWLAVSLGTTCLVYACKTSVAPERAKAELETGRRFVAERSFRREALERSLAMRDNGDARTRLARYAVADQWEALPVLNPAVAPVVRGELPVFARVWAGDVEWSEPAVLELGRRAFEEWPAQRLPQVARMLSPPSERQSSERRRLDAIGAWQDARGRVGGLVWVRYPDGTTEPALSCATCHARPDAAGRLLPGVPSDFDLGGLVGAGWGAGHVDVTVDARDNPVSAPDLRATRHQRRLHHTGNIHNSLEALAVRTETLLITARENIVRPPREIAFALAYYVWALGQGARAPAPSALFREQCGHCHSGATGAGELVSVNKLGTDAAATESSARGTGGYRAPSLYRVSERKRLTHAGWPLTLDQFFDPSRLSTLPGHPFGLHLSAEQRASLVSELGQW